MSCDYHIFCRSCEEEHPFSDANHARPLMRILVLNAGLIATLAPLLDTTPEHIELRTNYGPVDPSWFAKHLGHELVVRDEYGLIDRTCGKLFNCGSCRTRHYCRREQGHEGECSTILLTFISS